MRAAVIEEFGKLTIREAPDPKLRSGHDVIVRVRAAGVCRTDVETLHGGLVSAYGMPEFPYVPGHETAGVIEAVGAEVGSLRVGQPVVLHPLSTCGYCAGCRRGADMYCANSMFAGVDAKTWGGWAELVRVGERAVVPVADGTDDEGLAALAPYSDAGLTAFHAVERIRDRLVPGSVVVVIGSGGVGHFAVQLLLAGSRATVLVADTSPDRLRTAEGFGATALPAGGADAAVEAVRSRTDGGADVVMDFAGAPGSAAAGVAMLRKGGVLSLVGAGPDLTVNTLDIVVRELSIVSNIVGTHSELSRLVTMHGAPLESPHTVFPLDQAEAAIADLLAGAIEGRAVLVP
ncbi:alcohol dehydrogenase catalytic domain-containing protein [Pseudonocardia sp. NPDC049635]|uniref:alcohol dehydrogenase catalytic domain-containing protein n=1 Tax=Pseudonocardia sp. NPDC049635 TaxID=3155506 RepID=UPI0033D83D1F